MSEDVAESQIEAEQMTGEGLFSDDRPTPSAAPLALYRRYRPETFAEVIGQEHVTEPLQRALANNRVNHAYLFSGPRGCGKTTSARILARALNCEKGPRAEPCGECRSCRDLARGGPGSIDVIEIDAASHGGVDDARDLRERAFFAPVSSRYKIYIVDEAHMVTPAGFNALLKVVEEPPPHVKFVFATTEPDKVIGTIRSRTHHYPFRLVPPRTLSDYLSVLCDAEGIAVEPAVLPLVVRAGAGSVRDSLSVLDQLLGGAAASGVSYAQATALLGYTPDSLLDEIMDAFAAGDAAGVFACVDKVIEVGQDPRRFAEDLLRRIRDLMIVAAVPDALRSGLVEAAPDQAERLSSQASALGAGELTRAGEVLAAGLTEMRGTTAPRLHLELMCARVLLPGADVDDRGVHARLDRLERRIGMGEAPAPQALAAAAPVAPAQPAPVAAAPVAAAPVADAAVADAPVATPPQPEPVPPAAAPVADTPAATPVPPVPAGLNVTEVRRLWPEVLADVSRRRKFTWMLLSQEAQVIDVADGALVLGMSNPGARENFSRGGSENILHEALIEVLGQDLRIDAIVDPSAKASRGRGRPAPAPAEPAPRAAPASPASDWVTEPAPADPGPSSPASPPAPPAPPAPAAAAAPQEDLRESIRPMRTPARSRGGDGGGGADAEPDVRDAAAARDDADVEESVESHTELLARHLGAQVIEDDGPS